MQRVGQRLAAVRRDVRAGCELLVQRERRDAATLQRDVVGENGRIARLEIEHRVEARIGGLRGVSQAARAAHFRAADDGRVGRQQRGRVQRVRFHQPRRAGHAALRVVELQRVAAGSRDVELVEAVRAVLDDDDVIGGTDAVVAAIGATHGDRTAGQDVAVFLAVEVTGRVVVLRVRHAVTVAIKLRALEDVGRAVAVRVEQGERCRIGVVRARRDRRVVGRNGGVEFRRGGDRGIALGRAGDGRIDAHGDGDGRRIAHGEADIRGQKLRVPRAVIVGIEGRRR